MPASSRSRRIPALVVVCLLTLACGEESPPSSPDSPPTRLTIAEPPILRVGQTTQLVATATLADGNTRVVSQAATWQSSEPAVARISAAGLVTAVSIGISTVIASYQGTTASIVVHVFVSPPPQGGGPFASQPPQSLAPDSRR